MDPDDFVAAAIGALLTQLRSARRALEDVQRSTSRYGGFEFANAFASGERFGAPPLFDGALMVHVVNINDLAPGNSFGGFIEAMLGGVGNFFGNLIGGAVGGTLSGLALPKMIERLDRIVPQIGEIVDKLGIGQKKKKPDESAPEAQANTGESLLATLEGVRELVKTVTALFEVGAGKGSAGAADAARTSQAPLTETGERWMAILGGVNTFLDQTNRLVEGLSRLIPMAIGAIAFLLANLGEIRRALLETIQFLLRNALVLRGVLLTIVFETVASAARLAASVVGITGDTVLSVLTAIFAIIKRLLEAAFDALETLASAFKQIVDKLLTWLVDGLFNVLRAIGDLTVFRTVDHVVRVLPALLSALYMLKASKALPGDVQGMLTDAHKAAFAPPAAAAATAQPGTGGPVINQGPATTATMIGTPPDFGADFKALGATLGSAVDAAGADVVNDVKVQIGSITTTLGGVSGRFDKAARDEAVFSSGILTKYGAQITANADALTTAITAPVAADTAPTGFELIAKSYEQWLTGGGMKSVLDQASKHFTEASADGGGPPTGALRLLRGQFDRPRASIEIDEVEIVIQPAGPAVRFEQSPASEWGPGDFPTRSDEDVWIAVRRHERELEDRGIRPADLDALLV